MDRLFKGIWRFIKEVRAEAFKVNWPSSQEVMQTTIMIAIVVLPMALFLWGIDSLILYVIKWLANQKG